MAIKSIEEVDDRFHSRLSAKMKVYEYTIWKKKYNDVFMRRYAFRCVDLDVKKMKLAAAEFIGTHDFKGFCANKRMKKSTVRTVYSIDFFEDEETIRIRYTGNGFLYNMVRIMTGTLIEVGEGKRDALSIKNVLNEKDREMAGFTAPPPGLSLLEVCY